MHFAFISLGFSDKKETETMWLESILLRSNPEGMHAARKFLIDWLHETAIDAQIQEISLMERIPECGDLLVEIRWASGLAAGKTRTGYMIGQFLEQYGSIHHTTWVLKESTYSLQKKTIAASESGGNDE